MTRRTLLTALAAAPVLRSQVPNNLSLLSLRQASDLLRQNKVSSVELVQACLQRIEKHGAEFNTFITVTGERALDEAKERDAERRRGQARGPLHGVPLALKDNIDTAGIRTTAGSAVFVDRVPAEDATVVKKLRAAGAISVGKLNLHEFAVGGTSAVSFFGPVKNPWQPEYAAGGSSGGSAVAVACGFCYGALGTDTGGSIRTPAAFCGVVGLKPTYGRVSNQGVLPLSWSFDHVGPLTRTVEDAALLLQAIAGYDEEDVSSVEMPVPEYRAAISQPAKTMRLGTPRAWFYDKLDPDHAKAVGAAIDVLRRLTASVRDVVLPSIANFPPLRGESYAYHRELLTKHGSSYQAPTKRQLAVAEKELAADYILAMRELQLVRRRVRKVFETVDVLVTPTTPRPPYTIEESLKRAAEPDKVPVELSNTRPFNLYGLPTITVPCGFTAKGIPIGLQLSAAPWQEAALLRLAAAYEAVTEWHTKLPQLS